MAAPGPWLDAEFLQLKQIPLDAKLSVSSDFEPFDSTTQLVAISNIYGYVVLGRAQGFGFANTADVRNTMSASQKGTVTALDAIVPVDVQDGRVCLLSLSADQKTVVVGTSTGAILLFDAGKLAAGATMPSKKLDVTSSQLKKVSPNPEAYPDTIAVLTMGGEVFFVDSAGTSRRLPVEATAISWSRRGKQLACGTKDGKIVQLNLEGVVKNETPPPEGLVEGAKMGELLWLEDKVFLAVYSDAEEVTSLIYVVSRGGPEQPVSYTLLDDPVPAFLFPEGQLNSYYFEVVRSLGSFQYLGLLARTLSSEVGVIGCEDSGNWASWNLPDGAGASMPLDEEDRETYAVGFGIDYTSTSSLPPAEQDGSPLPPAPIIYILNNQGRLLTFHCINLKAKDATASCPAMVKELKTLKAESSPQKAVIPKKEEPVASTPVKIEFSSASIGKSSDAKTSETVGYTIGQEASKVLQLHPSSYHRLHRKTGQ
ncbi:hypothetical protein DFJ73DRAFT_428906 [Zopfochytrium polystomum]|nr:hypothetical protein DFJ73DRAFT_428906 [Zopfochytrium polystomum]